MQQANSIAQQAIDWLREAYDQYVFYVRRDVAWTLQMHLAKLVRQAAVDLRVFNDYPVLQSKPRPYYADLVLVESDGSIDVALEVSYEPAHGRPDIPESRFPMVFWGEDVIQDMQRAQEYVRRRAARASWSLFIDEGGHFRERVIPPGGEWQDWDQGRWALVWHIAQE